MMTSIRRIVGRPALAVVAVAVLAWVAVPFIQAQIIPPTDTTQTDTTNQPISGNTRQPIISGDGQFTTLTSGALQNRAPGNYTQQGMAVNNGTLNMFDGNVVDNPSFIGETFRMIMLDVLDMISQFLSSLNLVTGGNPLAGGQTTSLTNLLTGGTGSGSSVPIQ